MKKSLHNEEIFQHLQLRLTTFRREIAHRRLYPNMSTKGRTPNTTTSSGFTHLRDPKAGRWCCSRPWPHKSSSSGPRLQSTWFGRLCRSIVRRPTPRPGMPRNQCRPSTRCPRRRRRRPPTNNVCWCAFRALGETSNGHGGKYSYVSLLVIFGDVVGASFLPEKAERSILCAAEEQTCNIGTDHSTKYYASKSTGQKEHRVRLWGAEA